MDLWVAFLVGLVGSLHCAGMCGPLALALPGGSAAGLRLIGGRLAYNAGRVITYAAIGALFGSISKGLLLAGVQRWLSIGLGVTLLAGWFISKHISAARPLAALSGALAARMGLLVRNPSFSSLLFLGLLNGLLPCGLVYVAAAGAAATGSALSGAAYMVAFGAGTIPMLHAISLSRNLVPIRWRFKLLKAVPVMVFLLAALLILRGMSLGIPYISPQLNGSQASGCCHGGN